MEDFHVLASFVSTRDCNLSAASTKSQVTWHRFHLVAHSNVVKGLQIPKHNGVTCGKGKRFPYSTTPWSWLSVPPYKIMIPLDSATAILPRMPTGRALAAEFQLTIIKPPLLDTKCRSNSPAVSSPIYRLLQSRNRRRSSSASSVQSTLNNTIESTEFVTERVQVFELRDSSCQRSNVDSVSHQNRNQNTSTLRDNIVSYCQEESPTSRRNSSMESVKERSISIKEQSSGEILNLIMVEVIQCMIFYSKLLPSHCFELHWNAPGSFSFPLSMCSKTIAPCI